MAANVASETPLDQCLVLYLLLAWRDLLVVLATTKVGITVCVCMCARARACVRE